ncbi:Cro/CI family transcriptional regulator [Gallibacterium anatis]|uniref:Cro/CI family transcriptional regulator n=3 Tax=Gallibacterium anatis TaxID=750 RepID=A0A0A2YK34_9PAST|nr:Cro/CI family transcriptional regulator [Gallibacterium anatis]HJF78082.1 Cro/CI family transcriptional regulator [Enterococcus cecorum]ERF79474.1 regulatory protein [Gallibacterium anatis 12656/12]KGQ27293.1 Cro/Cl family transcriptional regulator [Gallibacterium anatis]KGQ37197.1 Cro/Cl family transcriptional regulator [Gallibacterium anatis IPDH697-78]KGQ37659.1 Cro/Cl family transcriptional regulator [Gallibacterium anatis]
MKRISLSEYAGKHGQGKTAKDLNVTQAAISKAIQSQRNIYLFVDKKGNAVRGEEIRPFPHHQN